MVRWCGLILGSLLTGPVWGQAVSVRPVDLPPLVLSPVPEAVEMPSGKPVSRPLQPVAAVEEPWPSLEPPTPTTVEHRVPARLELDQTEAIHPLGRYWESFEYLLWWPQAANLPPLLLANRGPQSPTLGGPNTQTLIGGRSVDMPDISGGRFTLGIGLNETETAGVSLTYFFLGTRTVQSTYGDVGSSRPRQFARPIVNAFTGEPEILPVVQPGQISGQFSASSSIRASGWEISSLANLYASPHVRFHALSGYRYFHLNEGLRLEQHTLLPEQGGYPAVLGVAADQIDTHNRFHGGQLGLQADFTRGPIFLEAVGKVALGQAVGVSRISGQTAMLTAGWPWSVQFSPVGVLGQASNSGRNVRSTFAVLPEAAVRLGYRFHDRSRFYVGYNLIYLNEVLRPGDQIDPMIDPSAVALYPRQGGPGTGSDRPGILLNPSDFWVQGLTFGLEYRY